jgi:hypothetical protein
MSDEVTISKGEYKELKEASLLLNTLIGAGVDNWEGWDDAFKDYDSIKGESKDNKGKPSTQNTP